MAPVLALELLDEPPLVEPDFEAPVLPVWVLVEVDEVDRLAVLPEDCFDALDVFFVPLEPAVDLPEAAPVPVAEPLVLADEDLLAVFLPADCVPGFVFVDAVLPWLLELVVLADLDDERLFAAVLLLEAALLLPDDLLLVAFFADVRFFAVLVLVVAELDDGLLAEEALACPVAGAPGTASPALAAVSRALDFRSSAALSAASPASST